MERLQVPASEAEIVDNPMMDIEMLAAKAPQNDTDCGDDLAQDTTYCGIVDVDYIPLKLFGISCCKLVLPSFWSGCLSLCTETTLLVLFVVSSARLNAQMVTDDAQMVTDDYYDDDYYDDDFGRSFANKSKAIALSIFALYFSLCWIVVPLWQNFVLISKATGIKTESCNNGCACALFCYRSREFCLNKYEVAWRHSEVSNSTRYMPFSPYNHLHLMLHPGKGLNHNLPKETCSFGSTRLILLVLSAVMRAVLMINIFVISSYTLYDKHASESEYTLSVIVLYLTLLDCRIVLVTCCALPVMLPVLVMSWVGCCLPDYYGFSNPSAGTFSYWAAMLYWNMLVRFE